MSEHILERTQIIKRRSKKFSTFSPMPEIWGKKELKYIFDYRCKVIEEKFVSD